MDPHPFNCTKLIYSRRPRNLNMGWNWREGGGGAWVWKGIPGITPCGAWTTSAAAVSHNDAEPSKQYIQQKYDQRGFQTEGVANVPLPSVKPDVNTNSNQTPSMIDLDELLTSETQNANIPELELPDLPNFEWYQWATYTKQILTWFGKRCWNS